MLQLPLRIRQWHQTLIVLYIFFFTVLQDGRTALSVAAEKGNIRIVERLTAAGADACAAAKVRASMKYYYVGSPRCCHVP